MPEYGHHLSAKAAPEIGEAPLIYAIGDIHGSLQKLRDLMTLCEQHAEGRSATFVFLGDYIDRGPDSRGVIEALMALQSRQPDHVIALKGNHEAFAIEVVDGERDAEFWLREGGAATLRSYRIDDARDHGRLIVHGHTPQTDGIPDFRGNRLNLDTGAVFGRPLTAAAFARAQRDPLGFLQAP